jgi:hypothetical protein
MSTTLTDVRDVPPVRRGEAIELASVEMLVGRRVRRELGFCHVVHGANEVQVRERAGLTPADVVDRWERAVPRALNGRRRFPRVLRPVRIRFEPPLGRRSLAYLMDIVYTRDVWMHRIGLRSDQPGAGTETGGSRTRKSLSIASHSEACAAVRVHERMATVTPPWGSGWTCG